MKETDNMPMDGQTSRCPAVTPSRPEPEQGLVSIVIVTYHNEANILPCLASIFKEALCKVEVVVVDNSTNDLTALQVEGFINNHPCLRAVLLPQKTNVGFARGCNLGADAAKGEFLLFLNPDTVLKNDAPSLMKNFLNNNPEAGLVGPQILNPDGKIVKTCRSLPDCTRIFLDMTGLDRLFGAYRLLHFSHRETRRVDQVIGAAFFVRTALFFAMSGFDERFFIYFEEVDFCKRLLNAGLQVWFYPKARVEHIAGASTESVDHVADMVAQLRRSRLLYFKKHFPIWACLVLAAENRAEGFAKSIFLAFLHGLTKHPLHREKARGFRRVALCPEYSP